MKSVRNLFSLSLFFSFSILSMDRMELDAPIDVIGQSEDSMDLVETTEQAMLRHHASKLAILEARTVANAPLQDLIFAVLEARMIENQGHAEIDYSQAKLKRAEEQQQLEILQARALYSEPIPLLPEAQLRANEEARKLIDAERGIVKKSLPLLEKKIGYFLLVLIDVGRPIEEIVSRYDTLIEYYNRIKKFAKGPEGIGIQKVILRRYKEIHQKINECTGLKTYMERLANLRSKQRAPRKWCLEESNWLVDNYGSMVDICVDIDKERKDRICNLVNDLYDHYRR